jgi:hypothetical protein
MSIITNIIEDSYNSTRPRPRLVASDSTCNNLQFHANGQANTTPDEHEPIQIYSFHQMHKVAKKEKRNRRGKFQMGFPLVKTHHRPFISLFGGPHVRPPAAAICSRKRAKRACFAAHCSAIFCSFDSASLLRPRI